MSQHLLSDARLYSLIGDGMHDLPTFFIDKLERLLADNGMPHPAFGSVPQLRLVRTVEDGDKAPPLEAAKPASLSVAADDDFAYGKQQALAAILEILHAAHQSQNDGAQDVLLGERLVEGLIVAARELVKVTGPAGDLPQLR